MCNFIFHAYIMVAFEFLLACLVSEDFGSQVSAIQKNIYLTLILKVERMNIINIGEGLHPYRKVESTSLA